MIETLGTLASAAGHDLVTVERRNLENPAVPISLASLETGMVAGLPYSTGAGTRFTAVWAAIRILSGIMGRIPVRPMRSVDGGASWTEDRGHYLHGILNGNWNEAMTAFRAKRLMQSWVLRDGNAYALVDYSPANGRVRALLPMRPDRVEFRGGRYVYHADIGTDSYPAARVLHIRGLEFDGSGKAINPLEHFRRTIGMALAQEEHAAAFYANGARPGGVLVHPATLDDEVKVRTVSGWQKAFGGPSNAHRIAILDEGMKYEPIVMNMVDAEFIATRRFSIADVSRIYGVPLHMLAELEKATNNNIEHQGLELERFSAADHIANWESELTDMLLSREERRTVRIEFDSTRLHSPDMESRMKTASEGVRGGIISPNEGRGWFGLSGMPGGDQLYMQQQMVTLGQGGNANGA